MIRGYNVCMNCRLAEMIAKRCEFDVENVLLSKVETPTSKDRVSCGQVARMSLKTKYLNRHEHQLIDESE